MKVLLTGATGFIGSNIAKGLLNLGYDVYATHRSLSSFEKCSQFKDRITWINAEDINWKNRVKIVKPDQLIHVSWDGLDFENRNNWEQQYQNFLISREYFNLAKECKIKKIIALGSQAEYGNYSSRVNETTLPKPDDAYGAIKTLTAHYLRTQFVNSGTSWYWIRIFSVFGEEDNKNWLIPNVIERLLRNESIALTTCEQEYNYLYIEDMVNLFLAIVTCNEDKSGVYNLCNSESISLKDLLIKIASLMNVSVALLKFGEIQMRTAQKLVIAGDDKKLIRSFHLDGYKPIGLSNGLLRTIEFYKKHYESI